MSEEALADVVSATRFYLETVGPDAMDAEALDARPAGITGPV